MAWIQIAVQVGLVLLGAGVSYYHARRQQRQFEDERPSATASIDAPVVTESAPIPVLFGTVKMKSPAVIWSGDFEREELERAGEKRYLYRMNCILSYCAGPIDAVRSIEVDTIPADTSLRDMTGAPVPVAWGVGSLGLWEELDGYNTSDLEPTAFDNFFGGWDGEGALQAVFRLCSGHPDQPVDPHVSPLFGSSLATAYRGLFTIVQGLRPGRFGDGWSVAHGYAPRLRQWDVTATRIMTMSYGDAQWYSEKAAIDELDINPAHVIREIYTDTRYGLGLAEEMIDDDLFEAAADALHGEGFGISLLWDTTLEARDLIQDVARHIDAIAYEDPRTGKVGIRLIRDDYDEEELPRFGPSEVVECELSKPRLFERPTMIHVIYRDRGADRERSVALHDPAGIEDRGEIPVAIQYPYITSGELATSVAARDLRQMSAPLFSASLTVTPEAGGDLLPGDLFILDWPMAGIESLVMRVRRINLGVPTSGEVQIEAMGDVFSAVAGLYAPPGDSTWADPIPTPVDADNRIIFEMPLYLQAAANGVSVGTTSWGDLADSDLCQAAYSIERPSPGTSGYELWVDTDGQAPFQLSTVRSFARPVEVSTAYGPDPVPHDTTSLYLDPSTPVQAGDLILNLDTGEMMLVDDYDPDAEDEAGLATVQRGIMDTTPAPETTKFDEVYIIGRLAIQAGGAAVFATPYYGIDTPRSTDQAVPREVELRALPITPAGVLPYDDATEESQLLEYRTKRPYPPGKCEAYEHEIPAISWFGVRVTWEHRNRILYPFPSQDDDFLAGPESGVEYELKIYEEAPTPQLLRTEDLAGNVTLYDYGTDDEESDRGSGLADRLRFELRSVKGGKAIDQTSYYAQVRIIDRT